MVKRARAAQRPPPVSWGSWAFTSTAPKLSYLEAKWLEIQKTPGFQLAKARAEAEVAAIVLGTKLLKEEAEPW